MTSRRTPLADCIGCGTKVRPGAVGVWSEITGWVKGRNEGGANHIAEAMPTGRYRCNACVTVGTARRVSPDQASLFDAMEADDDADTEAAAPF